MDFISALQQQDTITENGMTTNSSSLSSVVDLFFTIGALRGQEKSRLIAAFSKAFNDDPTRAMKILFWARDVRGGAGERQIFKDVMQYLADTKLDAVLRNMYHIPEFGRWDDLLVFEGTSLEVPAFNTIKDALIKDQNGLCAKWMPRKGATAAKLRNHMGLSPKQYRKLLVGLTNVVETKMCAKEWDSIEFGKIPSLASARYQKAFGRNAYEAYSNYINALQKGEAKINAGAVYPYDILKSINLGNSKVANEQWNALPNWMEGSNEMLLPVVDVSGSMCTPAGGNKNVLCLDVAISLGLYISERNTGAFENAFITFSGNPQLQILKGGLVDRYRQLQKADWAMNTDLRRVFKLILNQAKKHNLAQAEMPTKILILSDMEFDAACNSTGGWWSESGPSEWNPTAQQMIRKMYEEAGYEMPGVVYWNIQSRGANIPVSFNETGTALVSGFSPAIMTSLIKGAIVSPEQIMDLTIMSERYKNIK
jgi:hypothetical protein